jgi:hypothetical protein
VALLERHQFSRSGAAAGEILSEGCGQLLASIDMSVAEHVDNGRVRCQNAVEVAMRANYGRAYNGTRPGIDN